MHWTQSFKAKPSGGLQGKTVEERIAAAGGVPQAMVDAFTLLLQDTELDPALAAAAISLPAASEVVDMIPEADPVLLHAVRLACLLAPFEKGCLEPVHRPGHQTSFASPCVIWTHSRSLLSWP